MIPLFFALHLASFSGPDGGTVSDPMPCPADLVRMNKCQLDALFARGKVGAAPCGAGRGKVLLVVDALLPRVRARLMGTVWKGKVFHPCNSTITNQWCGFKAVDAPVTNKSSISSSIPGI